MPTANPRLLNGVASPQSIFEASTTKNHPLGTKGQLDDGRVFYYAKSSGAALTRGTLCRTAAEEGEHITIAAVATAANSPTVGVTLGSVSAAANLYADGDFIVIDGTNSGQKRRIISHASAATGAAVTLLLEAPLEGALTTSEECSLVKNPYADVVTTPGDAQVPVTGVPQFSVGAGTTNAQYFWLQTHGRASVQGDGSTFTLGCMVAMATAGTGDAGQITLVAGTASNASVVPQVVLGTLASLGDAASDLDYREVDLRIRG
jgi:hypothetical protein